MKNKLSEMASIAEITGAFAVVISLISYASNSIITVIGGSHAQKNSYVIRSEFLALFVLSGGPDVGIDRR